MHGLRETCTEVLDGTDGLLKLEEGSQAPRNLRFVVLAL